MIFPVYARIFRSRISDQNLNVCLQSEESWLTTTSLFSSLCWKSCLNLTGLIANSFAMSDHSRRRGRRGCCQRRGRGGGRGRRVGSAFARQTVGLLRKPPAGLLGHMAQEEPPHRTAPTTGSRRGCLRLRSRLGWRVGGGGRAGRVAHRLGARGRRQGTGRRLRGTHSPWFPIKVAPISWSLKGFSTQFFLEEGQLNTAHLSQFGH